RLGGRALGSSFTQATANEPPKTPTGQPAQNKRQNGFVRKFKGRIPADEAFHGSHDRREDTERESSGNDHDTEQALFMCRRFWHSRKDNPAVESAQTT